MTSICLTWFPIRSLGEPNIYHDSGDFTRMWDFTWKFWEGSGWRKRYDQEEDFTYKQMTSSRKCSRFIGRENLVTL